MRRLLIALALVPFLVSACGGGSTPTTPTPAATACTTITLSSTAISQSAGGGATSITVTATPANCTWTAVSGAAFLRITSQASGTGNGSFTFTTDPNTANGSRNGSITVGTASVAVTQDGVAPPLVFSPPAPPNGTVGVAYTHNFAVATGGVPPLTYTLDSGGFAPNGLILSPAGVLAGVPTAPTPLGGMTFRVCVSDGAGNRRCTGDLSITISAAAANPLGSWRGNIILQVGCTTPLPQTYPFTGTFRTAANGGTEFLVSVPTALVFNEVHPVTITGQSIRFTIDFGVILNFVGTFDNAFSSVSGTFTGTNCNIPPVVVIPSGTWNGTKQ